MRIRGAIAVIVIVIIIIIIIRVAQKRRSANDVACSLARISLKQKKKKTKKNRLSSRSRRTKRRSERKEIQKVPRFDEMISKQKTYLIMTLYLVFSADSGSPVVFLILRMSARDRERVMMCRE